MAHLHHGLSLLVDGRTHLQGVGRVCLRRTHVDRGHVEGGKDLSRDPGRLRVKRGHEHLDVVDIHVNARKSSLDQARDLVHGADLWANVQYIKRKTHDSQ